VDNFVGNHPLTGGNARFYAGFNKLLIFKAKINSFKISDLQNYLNREKYTPLNFVVFIHIFYFVNKSLGVAPKLIVSLDSI
jgi:hypothetical protein